jgi:sugar lactone lactonase YvrE
VLDDQDQLFRSSGGTTTGTALSNTVQPNGHYVAMTTLDPDIYLLDTAGSQVWRYPYAVSGYNPQQAGYWDTNPPKLSSGVSLAFDQTSLYILRSDGSVLKYDLQANPQKFTMNLQTPLTRPVSLYTDTNQKWVWIADPVHKRIVQLDKDGGYSQTYLSSSTLDLSKTQSISVGPAGNTIYVLAGSKLYEFPVTQ